MEWGIAVNELMAGPSSEFSETAGAEYDQDGALSAPFRQLALLYKFRQRSSTRGVKHTATSIPTDSVPLTFRSVVDHRLIQVSTI